MGKLLQDANFDVNKAQQGIIFLDEVKTYLLVMLCTFLYGYCTMYTDNIQEKEGINEFQTCHQIRIPNGLLVIIY